jgi:3-methylfumaryl-CoA hydratase
MLLLTSKVGETVERRSKITDGTVKERRTGTLCFVTVEHSIFSPRGLAVAERQDIVYRA